QSANRSILSTPGSAAIFFAPRGTISGAPRMELMGGPASGWRVIPRRRMEARPGRRPGLGAIAGAPGAATIHDMGGRAMALPPGPYYIVNTGGEIVEATLPQWVGWYTHFDAMIAETVPVSSHPVGTPVIAWTVGVLLIQLVQKWLKEGYERARDIVLEDEFM